MPPPRLCGQSSSSPDRFSKSSTAQAAMRHGQEGEPNRPAFRVTSSQSGLTFPFLCLQNELPGRTFWIWCWAVGGGSIWHHYLAQSMGWSISNWQGSGVIKLGILIPGGGRGIGHTPTFDTCSRFLLHDPASTPGSLVRGVWGLRSACQSRVCFYVPAPFMEDILGSERSRSHYGLVMKIGLALLCWVRNLGPWFPLRQKDKNKILLLR